MNIVTRAHQVLGDAGYRDAAERAAGFVKGKLYDSRAGVLRRRFRAGEAAVDAFAEAIQLDPLNDAAFLKGELGYANAIGFVLLAGILAATLMLNRLSRRFE